MSEVQPLMNNTNEERSWWEMFKNWWKEFLNFCCCCCTNTEDYENKDVKDHRSSISNSSNRQQIRTPSNFADSSRPTDRESMRAFKPISLMNVGATCYLNSAFQGISACDLFVEDIDELAKKYHSKIDQLDIFKELMDILNGCSQRRMNISRNPIFRNWNKPGQQDSYELLAYALNQVYNSIRTHKENTTEIRFRDLDEWLSVKLPMRCILKYTITCDCSAISYSPLQSDLALHVTIPMNKDNYNLTDLVHEYFGVDPIEDFVCDNPKCKGRSAKRLARLREPVPKTLCIHLQRTHWNGRRMEKINKPVKFELQLKIKSEYIDLSNEKLNSEKNVQIKDEEDTEKKVVDEEMSTYSDVDNQNGDKTMSTNDPTFVEEGSNKENEEKDDDGASIIDQQESGSSEKKVVDEEKSALPDVENESRDKSMNTNDSTPDKEGKDKGNAEKDDKDDNGARIINQQESPSYTADNRGFRDSTIISEDAEKKVVDGEISIYSDVDKESGDKTMHESDRTSVEEGSNKENEKKDDKDAKPDRIYTLVSVIVHSGNVNAGHYVCYKRICDKWFLTNDGDVKEVRDTVVFGSQAYILFYEQRRDND